ncbi:lipopolysaccharide biosynthesis protein [Vibrio cholerae]|nr:lipopolysaccharide biosynthesis protein [Vibrio cholerae]EJL6690510.1 lipopolysaccharide biosynthesis protein [Vibrio cholerae]
MLNYIWIIFEKLGVVLIRLLTIVILARYLEPRDFGLYSMVAIVVVIANVLIDSGISGSLIQKEKIDNRYYDTAFTFNFSVAVILAVLSFNLSHYIANFYNEPELVNIVKVLSFTIVIKSLSTTQCAILTRNLSFRSQTIVFLSASIISLFIGVYFAKNGFGYWSLVYMQLAESLLVTLSFWIISNYRPRLYFSAHRFLHLYSFGGRLMLSSLIYSLYSNVINVILGKKFGSEMLGYFYQAQKISDMYSNTLTLIIDKAIFPKLSRKSKNKEEFILDVRKIVPIICLIAFFVPVLIMVNAEFIIETILGDGWSETTEILSLLSFSLFGLIIESYSRCFLKSLGEASIILRQELFKRIVGIFVLSVASFFGLYSVIYSFVALTVLYAIINGVAFCRVVKIRVFDYYLMTIPSIAISLITMIVFTNTEQENNIYLFVFSFCFYILLSAFWYFLYSSERVDNDN